MSAPLGVLGGPTRSVLEYGTGRLGDATFSADGSDAPTNWTWDGATSSWRYTDGAALLEYRNITIAAGVTIRPAGCPLAISGTLTMGSSASVSAGGHAASVSTGGATVTRVAGAWLGAGSAGGSGTVGGNAGSASAAIASGALGGRGGAGGSVYSTPTRAGGTGGTITAWDASVGPVVQALALHPFQGRGSVTPAGGTGGGSGGSAGATGLSCGGGGGGGCLVVMARRIVYEANPSMAGAPSYWLPAHFTAHGGDGSAEGTGSAPAMKGGGGGGGGGGVFLLVDTLSPVNGSTAITVSARGGWGGDAYDVGSSAAADGGSGGSGGQVWVAYCVGPTPTAEVFGAPGGGGALGGASGATGSNGSAYLLSMIGR